MSHCYYCNKPLMYISATSKDGKTTTNLQCSNLACRASHVITLNFNS